MSLFTETNLANWPISVIFTLINNDKRLLSGQNVMDSRGVAEWVHNKFWPLEWLVSMSLRVQTTLNHISIQIVFFNHNINVIVSFFFQSASENASWRFWLPKTANTAFLKTSAAMNSFWFKFITWRDSVYSRRDTTSPCSSPLNFLRFFLVQIDGVTR